MHSKLYALEQRAALGMERIMATVPFTREFHEGTATHRGYYTRHMIEAVLRIRLNNEADAYCLFKISKCLNRPATQLVQYLAEEYGHDEILAQDLVAFGVTEHELAATPPFFATELLMGYLRYAVDQDGPLPTFVWNWFVEWYSDRYNPGIVARAREEFGPESVHGTTQHLELDKELDHEAGIGAALAALLDTQAEIERALLYIDRFVQLVAWYFNELYEATIGSNTKNRESEGGQPSA
jgi:hypothetical protein